MNRRQWLTIALPFAAGTAGLFASDREAVAALPNTPDQIRWSERISHLGGLYTIGGVIGAELLIGNTTDRPHLSQLGRLASEAVIDSMVVSYGVKNSHNAGAPAGKPRPGTILERKRFLPVRPCH
jgi:hypothetical protein